MAALGNVFGKAADFVRSVGKSSPGMKGKNPVSVSVGVEGGSFNSESTNPILTPIEDKGKTPLADAIAKQKAKEAEEAAKDKPAEAGFAALVATETKPILQGAKRGTPLTDREIDVSSAVDSPGQFRDKILNPGTTPPLSEEQGGFSSDGNKKSQAEIKTDAGVVEDAVGGAVEGIGGLEPAPQAEAPKGPTVEYWGIDSQPYLQYETNPDIQSTLSQIEQRYQDEIKANPAENVLDIRDRVTKDAWDAFVAKDPSSAQRFADKNPQLQRALERADQKKANDQRLARMQAGQDKMPQTESDEPVLDTTEKIPVKNVLAQVDAAQKAITEPTSGIADFVNAPSAVSEGQTSTTQAEAAEHSQEQSSPASGNQKTEVTPNEQQTEPTMKEKAYSEITGENIGYTIDATSTVGELMQKLTTEKGWQWDGKTVDYVQGAIDHAKALEQKGQEAQERQDIITGKSGGEQRSTDEATATRTEQQGAVREEKIYESPLDDPDMKALTEEITRRTNLDRAVTKARDGEGGNHSDEWARAESRIAVQQYDIFVEAHPEKARAYADKDPRIQAALARREERMRRSQEDQHATNNEQGQEIGADAEVVTGDRNTLVEEQSQGEVQPVSQTENEQITALERLVREQAGKIDTLTEVLAKLQEPMKAMQEAMDIEDQNERRKKIKDILVTIIATLGVESLKTASDISDVMTETNGRR